MRSLHGVFRMSWLLPWRHTRHTDWEHQVKTLHACLMTSTQCFCMYPVRVLCRDASAGSCISLPLCNLQIGIIRLDTLFILLQGMMNMNIMDKLDLYLSLMEAEEALDNMPCSAWLWPLRC